mmetsp:Transcript_36478/g.58740  ORF Transcript_36478/g.58740 Transcript_36478/m.58740 type:complete len:214 (+) Transcript_36478:1308-1949(+)
MGRAFTPERTVVWLVGLCCLIVGAPGMVWNPLPGCPAGLTVVCHLGLLLMVGMLFGAKYVLWACGIVGTKYPALPGWNIWLTCPICCPCIRMLVMRCMYWEARWALRSSFLCARATYRGLATTILPFISVTALVASSGELKHTNPKPFDLPPSVITLALVMVPNCANSFLKRSSSMLSSRFLTYKLTPWYLLILSILMRSNFSFSSAWRSIFF